MNLIIDSKFKPFTFDELVKPLIMYQAAYNEQENALADLQSQANVWEKLADSAQDEEVYNQYKAYANSVRNQAESIARQGLTPGSRKAMLDLKARYASDIDPIEKAWNERDRQFKAQQEMMLKDPTHRFRQSANEVGLKEFMSGQYDALADNFSGAVLEKQASEAAENLKGILRDPGKLQSLGLPYQYERRLKYGFSTDEINKAINGDGDADPVLKHIIDSVLESSGVNNWNNDKLSREARSFAARGLYSALGSDKIEHFKDDFSSSDALDARRQARAFDYAQRAAKAKAAEDKEQRMRAINPLNLYSAKERTQAGEDIKKYSKYFTKDKNGNITLTNDGLKEYNRIKAHVYTQEQYRKPNETEAQWRARVGNGGSVPSDFRVFMNNLTGSNNILEDGKYTSNSRIAVGKAWGDYTNLHNSERYDAHRETEFDYTLNDADEKTTKRKIAAAVGNGTLQAVDYDGKTRTFKPTGDKLKLSDFNKDDYHVISTRLSSKGTTVMIQDKDGKVQRYLLPAGINTSSEKNTLSSLQRAEMIRNLVTSENLSTLDLSGLKGVLQPQEYSAIERRIQSGIPLTAEEKASLSQMYSDALDSAHTYHSQLWYVNKTKDQEYEPTGY